MDKRLGEITFETSDGKSASLKDYHGKVRLVVNVASKCGLTPQYEGLEDLYNKYQDAGLVVLGFPANEFGDQEPGSNEEIQKFCKLNYGVSFPVFKKIVVKGEGQHPLYAALTEIKPERVKKEDGQLEGKLKEHGLLSGDPEDIMWNFEKFLIDKEGKVVRRFAPDIAPTDPVLVKAIEESIK